MTLFIIDDDSKIIFFEIAGCNTKSLTFLLRQNL